MEDIIELTIELTNDLAATGTSFEFWGRRTAPKRNVTLVLLNPPPPVIEIPRKRDITITALEPPNPIVEIPRRKRNLEIIIWSYLKSLEGQTFPSETALFDTLVEAGVSTLGSYRSGGHNKDVAKKEAGRYVEYKLTQEIDPNCKSKRQCTVIKVYDTPKKKVNKSGKSGKYINHLRPLIVMHDSFQGTKAELFDGWGLYDLYKGIGIAPETRFVFNPWKVPYNALPGDEAYRRKINRQEKDRLEGALDSLQGDGVLTWEKVLKYTPRIETDGENNSVFRVRTYQEWENIHQNRLSLLQQIADDEGCVLNPELYAVAFEPLMYGRYHDDYYRNGNWPEVYDATPEQKEWYENYCLFLRQLTVTLCNKQETYIALENLPKQPEFWTDPKYRKKYDRLNKELKERLLGWGSVWWVYKYEIIDHQKAEQYKVEDISEHVVALGKKFFNYMDEHMDRIELDNDDPRLKEDFTGVGKPRRWTLATSISATSLHEKLKEAQHQVPVEILTSSEVEETT